MEIYGAICRLFAKAQRTGVDGVLSVRSWWGQLFLPTSGCAC